MEGQRSKAVKVLLVEDSPSDIGLIKKAMRGIGSKFELTVVLDGMEALDLLFRRGKYEEAARPDFIILDINLPGKNGHEILSELSSQPALRKIPVVVFSSSPSGSDVRRAYELSANCYVQKPTELDDFFGAVHDIETFWLERAQLA